MVMEIKDDGHGFEIAAAKDGVVYNKNAQGNGLANMQKRAAELKGRLTIHSAPGTGTNLALKFYA
jgi:signal transduction histidine kinase